MLMRLSTVLNSLKIRISDWLGGARFAGGGGAAVALIEANGRILRLSDPAARMFADAGRAEALAELFMPSERDAIERAVRSKAACRIMARARRPGGGAADFEIAFERRPDGRSAALLIDRTAERSETRLLETEIDRSREEAAEGAAMLADLSHEMRTPLNAVIGFAETIERQTFGPVGHENYAQYAEHIRMAGRHLLDLVNVVLDLSKIKAERYALNRVAADPAAIARECAGIMRHQAEAAGLVLCAEIAKDLPECYLDPRAVRQILLNLLSNAVKFTPDGEVCLSARRDGDAIVFVVKDEGVGMSEEALSKIGARFTAAHGSGVRGQGGAGLGLSLAMSLAELHGGRVSLATAPGEGLTAEVRLPILAAPAPTKGALRTVLDLSAGDNSNSPLGSPAATELDRIKAARRARLDADAA
ncbi:MAG: HAMP domain-containing histidine kinase [Parvularculaceae bacterium]|nr:HAMP domain-containing histidine kinase [Parvularculaceae bacterium]